LGLCIDLAGKISSATTVLAGMFHDHHAALPRRWLENPEIERTILTMTGHVELGILRAEQAGKAHMGDSPRTTKRIGEVATFLGILQEKHT
jgi:hypothetical protein